MIRTVVAFENDETRTKIAESLEKSGIAVRYRCRTGMDVIRAIKRMGGGVVVCGHKLADMTSSDIIFELQDLASFLIVARRDQLNICEDEGVFTLPMPVKVDELCGSVRMLMQMDVKHCKAKVPQRSEEDRGLIEQAKALLMEKNHFTEDQAHRFLQRKSMATSSKLADTARLIIAAFDDN